MPSPVHQWLVLWLARKLTSDGYLVGGYEGPTPHGGVWNALPPPFELDNVRPDLWALLPQNGAIAFGEAKTSADIDTPHTLAQLRILGRIRHRATRQMCCLYIAIPRSAAYLLDRALVKVRLLRAPNVVRLHVPDCLLSQGACFER